MIHGIRCYQPVQIPGKTNINMISKKQLPELKEIKRCIGGFLVLADWPPLAISDNNKEPFNLFVPDSNIVFAYVNQEADLMKDVAVYKAENFTLAELKQIARSKGIRLDVKATKQEYLDVLNESVL